MKKFFIMIVTVFALLPVFIVDAFADDGNYHSTAPIDISESGIFDGYDFFDDKEEQELTELIQDTARQLDMNIFIFIADSKYRMSDSQTEIFADDKYDEMFGEDTDGVFYFMDFSGKKPAFDYISTSGKAVLFYKSNTDDIFHELDNFLPPSSVSDYKPYKDNINQAIQHFLLKLSAYQNKSGFYFDGSSGKYFYYKGDELFITKNPPLRVRLIPLIFALPVGLLTTIIFYFSVKSKYKFRLSASPNNYVSHETTRFITKSDIFIGTHTTKTKIESSSSGGSHHSGGGHSHSGGHGGGGHHR